MSRLWRSIYRFGGLLVLFTFVGHVVRADGDFRTVALSGGPAPGAGSGVTFTDFAAEFEPPLVNKLGQAAFHATLSSFEQIDPFDPQAVVYDTAIYSEGSGSLELIAKKRNRPPGTASGVRYANVSSLNMNDAGRVAYAAYLDGPLVNYYELDDTGIWSNRSGATSLVARAGQQAAGYPAGVDLGLVLHARLNSSGRMAYGAFPVINHSASTNVGAIWTDLGGGAFQPIARTGDPAPGLPSGVNYGIVGTDFWLNDAGELGYATSLEGSQTGSALWTKRPGQPPSLVIHYGVPAPGLPDLQFASFDCCIEFGGAESIAFGGRLSGLGVDEGNDEAMFFAGQDGEAVLLAREGQHAFGLPDGVVFGRIGDLASAVRAFRDAKVNRQGDILLRAGLRGPGITNSNNSGIWFGNADDGFQLIARAGSQAPDTPPGSVFQLIEDSALNEAGQLAFFTRFSGAPGFGSNSSIWATDRDGDLQLVVRQGQQIDVDDGPGVDLRTIQSFLVTPEITNHDTNSISLGKRGHIAFRVEFTDATRGLFVSSAVAVPEPSGGAMLALLLAGVLLGRRRTH